MTKTAKAITDERQSTHGDWDEGAAISEDAMAVFTRGSRWDQLTPGMKQSVRMIVHKIHRVVTGSPFVKDHWDDIGGYAELVSRKLESPIVATIAAPKVPASAPMVRKVRMAQAKAWKARGDQREAEGVSLKGAKARPRLGVGTRGIVRAGKPFRKAKAHRRAAKAGK